MDNTLLEQLITAMRCLPGIGPKSAQRMAFHLLCRQREAGKHLGNILLTAMDSIDYCQSCRAFTESTLCHLCQSSRRDTALLCIVETPADLYAIEATGFNGLYFVLHGRLSPIDGIGPNELGIEQLKTKLHSQKPTEIILATNPTVEGEATSHYLAELAKHYQIPCTRIAHGVPLGGELEYLDGGTLAHAFTYREKL